MRDYNRRLARETLHTRARTAALKWRLELLKDPKVRKWIEERRLRP